MALTESKMLPLATPLPDFNLTDPATLQQVDKSIISAAAEGVLVAVICNHCPYVQHLRPQLAELCAAYRERVFTLAVSANDSARYPDDSPQQMLACKEEFGFTFPYLWDEEQQFVQQLRAVCTPEFYLFDANRLLVYRGRFDASRPGNDVPVDGADLRLAIENLLNGQAPLAQQQPSIGCSIKWLKGKAPAYV